jgi:hypothetical protein
MSQSSRRKCRRTRSCFRSCLVRRTRVSKCGRLRHIRGCPRHPLHAQRHVVPAKKTLVDHEDGGAQRESIDIDWTNQAAAVPRLTSALAALIEAAARPAPKSDIPHAPVNGDRAVARRGHREPQPRIDHAVVEAARRSPRGPYGRLAAVVKRHPERAERSDRRWLEGGQVWNGRHGIGAWGVPRATRRARQQRS